jgi:glucose uptake protein GlcU
MIAVHVLEVAIVGLTVAIVESNRPAYSTTDVLMMIAVGMIAGAIYIESMRWITKYEIKRSKDT